MVEKVPEKVQAQVEVTLDQVGDDVGTEEINGHLLVFEGWGPACVAEVPYDSDDPEASDKACEEYAESKTDEILKEWKEKYGKTHCFLDGGYRPGGLYGVTWSLFRKGRCQVPARTPR